MGKTNKDRLKDTLVDLEYEHFLEFGDNKLVYDGNYKLNKITNNPKPNKKIRLNGRKKNNKNDLLNEFFEQGIS